MINPAPATKFNGLVDEVNRFVFSAEEPNDFALRRFEKEAEKLKKHQVDEGFLMLGMLAMLNKNVALMRKNMDLAIRTTQQPADILRNYATSLGLMGLYLESAEKMAEAANLKKDNDTIARAISTSIRVGRFAEANTLLETAKNQKWTIDPKFTRLIPQGLALMQRHHLDRKQVDDLVQAAEACLQQFEAGRFISKAMAHEVLILEHEGREWVYIQYFLNTNTDEDIEKVVDLDVNLADTFAQKGFRNNPASPYFVIEFSAMSPDELNDQVQRSF